MQWRRRWAMAITIVMFVQGASEISDSAEPPRAEAPIYTVGDEWLFNTGPVKVVAIEEGLVVRVFPRSKCPGCRYYSNKDWILVAAKKADGTAIDNPLVGLPILMFPLYVGKEWDYSSMTFNPSSNLMRKMTFTNRVMTYEILDTKAGPLQTFKIATRRANQHLFSSSERGDWGTVLFWYSPEAKTIVKRQVISTGYRATFGSDYEIEAFSLK
jgi:hypothetical protein